MKSRIGEFVQKSGYKKQYIAEQLGISKEQFSRWVSGKSYPRLDKAFELAELLSVKVDDLYERGNTSSSESEGV